MDKELLDLILCDIIGDELFNVIMKECNGFRLNARIEYSPKDFGPNYNKRAFVEVFKDGSIKLTYPDLDGSDITPQPLSFSLSDPKTKDKVRKILKRRLCLDHF